MLMELGVADRLLLLATLPKEGDITTLKIMRQLTNDLALSDEELEILHPTQADGQITWQTADALKIPAKGIEISPQRTALIADALKKMSDAKQLTPQHVSLYEKFVED